MSDPDSDRCAPPTMTLHQFYAGMALHAIVPTVSHDFNGWQDAALRAIHAADAMIAAYKAREGR